MIRPEFYKSMLLYLQYQLVSILISNLKSYLISYKLFLGEYSQEIPSNVSWEKISGPPILPPHLLQVILNKDTPLSVSFKSTENFFLTMIVIFYYIKALNLPRPLAIFVLLEVL